MVAMQIRRIAEDRYIVRQYDDVLSVELGEMTRNKLNRHLRRDLILRTPEDIFQSLKVGEEITVKFRSSL